MQLYILHINNGGEKLEVYTSEEQCDKRFDSFYDEDCDPEEDPTWFQENIQRYVALSMEQYLDICKHVGCTPDHSLWFLDGDIVDYKDIHNYPGLWENNLFTPEQVARLYTILGLMEELGPDVHEYIIDAVDNDLIDTYFNITKSQIEKRGA